MQKEIQELLDGNGYSLLSSTVKKKKGSKKSAATDAGAKKNKERPALGTSSHPHTAAPVRENGVCGGGGGLGGQRDQKANPSLIQS